MTSTPLRIGGVVLCGGGSRRMGSPKPWLVVGAEPMLARVVRVVAKAVSPVVVVGKRGASYPPLPADIILGYDAVDDAGPLAGLATGFEMLANRCDAAFVASCDHPLLSVAFVRAVVERLGDEPAVVPMDGKRSYPLVAAYRLSVRSVLAEQLANGDLRVQEFARVCGARFVAVDELREADSSLDSLRNVNDQPSYEAVCRIAGE
ncbi:MAG: molybdenum cofactor guanylyltransferase [Planctomycetes bacterium]|nr:molybdenum cofactor guanylyltransferase [Planctomycetota bacterium]